MSRSGVTEAQMIEWINVQLENILIMRDRENPDPYFDDQAKMFSAIKDLISQNKNKG